MCSLLNSFIKLFKRVLNNRNSIYNMNDNTNELTPYLFNVNFHFAPKNLSFKI